MSRADWSEAPDWDGEAPESGSKWEHHSGRVYRVIGVANASTQRPDEYPVTIIYENVDNSAVWCRPASEWARSFKPYRTAAQRAVQAMESAYHDGAHGRIVGMQAVYNAIAAGNVPGVKLTEEGEG